MNLAVDIGNTNFKCGIFDGGQLVQACSGIGKLEEILKAHKITRAILSKSGTGDEMEKLLSEKQIPYLLLSYQLRLPVEITYHTPDTLGSDRIAGSVAAHNLFPRQPVLKIDFGTCITYDFVNTKGQYIGGAISPGLTMRFKALNHFTAKLPLVDTSLPSETSLTGVDTTSSIRSGVIHGIRNEVTGIIGEYRSLYPNLRVVCTGGDAGVFDALLKSEIFTRPNLVLEGLNIILNYNQ